MELLMAFKVSYSNKANFPQDRDPATILTATLEEAMEKANELKKCGFKNIVVYNAETNKAVEVY
jgi:hypothetical protein